MTQTYDAIVVGAGHNGLTCACYLADAGLRVLVLDRYHTVGGMTTTEEITLPGFRSDLHAFGYQFANLSPVPQELRLADHGFGLIRPDVNFAQIFPDGGMVAMHRNVDDTVASIGRHSTKDGATWRQLADEFVHSPEDMERRMRSAVRGTVAHGAFLPYQMGALRPLPELGQYRTPIPNVYLCGSGSHPGGGVSMAPGRNAARAILDDLARG